MFEILIRIESLCIESGALGLLAGGLVVLAVGLLLWLGGTYFSSFIIGLLGAVVGSSCGLLVSQWLGFSALISMSVGAIGFAIAAVLFKNILIVILATIIFALAGGTIYSSMVLKETVPTQASEFSDEYFQPFSLMEVSDRLAYANEIAGGGESFPDRLRLLADDTLADIGPYKWKILLFALIGGGGGLLLIWLIRKLVLAVCYSTVGTFLVLVGVEVLLLAMNLHLCSWFQQRRTVFSIIFLSMAGLGTIFQLVSTRRGKGQAATVTTEKGEKAD